MTMFDALVIAAAIYLISFPWFLTAHTTASIWLGQVFPIFIGAALVASLYARFFVGGPA